MLVRPGYDARRRNRRQGTAARGHGNDNRMVVPDVRSELGVISWRSWPGVPVQRVGAHQTVHREVAGKRWTFVVERTSPDSWHACSVDDLARMLSLIPARFHEDLDLVILHQPTRKHRQLNCAWGQHCYSVEAGRRRARPTAAIRAAGPASAVTTAPVAPAGVHAAGVHAAGVHAAGVRRGRSGLVAPRAR
jgi:hypothetical protein